MLVAVPLLNVFLLLFFIFGDEMLVFFLTTKAWERMNSTVEVDCNKTHNLFDFTLKKAVV